MIRIRPRRAALAVAYMVGIFSLSSLSGSQLARIGLWDLLVELGHIPLFAGLAAATLWALVGRRLPCALAAGLVCGAFAITDEWHQAYVPGRVPSLDDLAADGAGIAIGVAIVSALPRRLNDPEEARRGEAQK